MTTGEFKRLITSCSDTLWHVAASMMQSPEEAQDVISDTIEKLWKVNHRLDKVDNQEGYVVTALRRTALDALRKKSGKGERIALEDNMFYYADAELTPLDNLERISELELLKDMIHLLPGKQKTVLELTAFNGLSNAEVAEIVNLSIENVRVLLSRARFKLRNAYRKFYNERL